MTGNPCRERHERRGQLMQQAGVNVVLLTKAANMFCLAGDGHLCAYATIARDGKAALGVPRTDVEDVKGPAYFDHVTGFDDEVGMIHSIAHTFDHLGISKGIVGPEYTLLTQPMTGMLTHPHSKPEKVGAQRCTPMMSAWRMVKEPEEIERIENAPGEAEKGLEPAVAPFLPASPTLR